VVLLTAASLRHVQEADVQAQAILRKPFDMEALEAVLEQLLRAAPATADGARTSDRAAPHDQPQARHDQPQVDVDE
jgi:DNA-binding LytR/AlgR family response regulator